jgi:hypothetical protein
MLASAAIVFSSGNHPARGFFEDDAMAAFFYFLAAATPLPRTLLFGVEGPRIKHLRDLFVSRDRTPVATTNKSGAHPARS